MTLVFCAVSLRCFRASRADLVCWVGFKGEIHGVSQAVQISKWAFTPKPLDFPELQERLLEALLFFRIKKPYNISGQSQTRIEIYRGCDKCPR